MKTKVVLCNCKGTCDSFKDTDMNTLPFEIESALDVEYVVAHAQLCGQGGNKLLSEVFAAADPDTRVIVGACAPKAQEKLFAKLMRKTGFDPSHMIPVDIRGTDNPGILARLEAAAAAPEDDPSKAAQPEGQP